MADKYDIPSLKAATSTKFEPLVHKLNHTAFFDIIETVYTTTPASCQNLRHLIVTECNFRIDFLEDDPSFIEVLHRHADLGAAMAIKVNRTLSIALEDVHEELGEERDQLGKERNNIERLEGENSRLRQQIIDKDGALNTKQLEIVKLHVMIRELRTEKGIAIGSSMNSINRGWSFLPQTNPTI